VLVSETGPLRERDGVALGFCAVGTTTAADVGASVGAGGADVGAERMARSALGFGVVVDAGGVAKTGTRKCVHRALATPADTKTAATEAHFSHDRRTTRVAISDTAGVLLVARRSMPAGAAAVIF
jgi:hypothetical protein